MNVLRLCLAVAWTVVWGTARWLKMGLAKRRSWAFSWGRHDSPKAMRCAECGWRGPLRWAVHTYEASGWDDVEPVGRCPRCDEDALHPVFWNRQKGWSS